MTYNVFGGTLNLAQSNRPCHVGYFVYAVSQRTLAAVLLLITWPDADQLTQQFCELAKSA